MSYGAVIDVNDNAAEGDAFIDYDNAEANAEENNNTKPGLLQEMVAECIGTCILTQIGCAGLCASKYLGAYDGLWQAAVIWLLGAALAISVTGPISGAHLNPAVSVSFFSLFETVFCSYMSMYIRTNALLIISIFIMSCHIISYIPSNSSFLFI